MSARTKLIARLRNRVICHHCGATITTYARTCSVPLEVRCDGFEAVELALAVEKAAAP